MEIWPCQYLRDMGGVVGPVTHHTVVRRDNFMRDLYQVVHPIVLSDLDSNRCPGRTNVYKTLEACVGSKGTHTRSVQLLSGIRM